MTIQDTMSLAASALKAEKISFALIGGFALAAHGVVRATQDIDFLIDGDKRDLAETRLVAAGFKKVFSTEEVLHLSGQGQLDILFANRAPSKEMLRRAKPINDFPVPVLAAEDLIGLKIQAYKNDFKREFQDKADIQALLEKVPNLNFQIVKNHADLFAEWPFIEELRGKL